MISDMQFIAIDVKIGLLRGVNLGFSEWFLFADGGPLFRHETAGKMDSIEDGSFHCALAEHRT